MYDYKSKIEKGFHYLGISVIRYRLAILLMTVVVAGLAATQLPKLSIATSIESMFTRHDQILTDYQRFRSQFGRDEEIVLLISSSDIFSLEFLTTFKQFHGDLENSLPLLKEVSSLANAPYIEAVDSGVRVGCFLAPGDGDYGSDGGVRIDGVAVGSLQPDLEISGTYIRL